MGNEASTAAGTSVDSSAEHGELQIEGLIPLGIKHQETSSRGDKTEKLTSLQTPRKRNRGYDHNDDDDDDDNDGDNNDIPPSAGTSSTINKRITTDRKYSRNHSQGDFFSEGSLRGTMEHNNDDNICRDPVLDAVAAGSAVRKAKHERSERIRQQQQQQQQQKLQRARSSAEKGMNIFFADNNNNNNEWKTSLRRLAKTAASTVKTVAHVTAPVIIDARQVVVSSATEFAQDVKKEWDKGDEISPTKVLIIPSFNDEEKNNKKNHNDAIDGSVAVQKIDITLAECNGDKGTEDASSIKAEGEHSAYDQKRNIEMSNNEERNEELDTTTHKEKEQYKKDDDDEGIDISSKVKEMNTNLDRTDPMNTTVNADTMLSPQTPIVNERTSGRDSIDVTENISFELPFDEKKEMDDQDKSDDVGIEIDTSQSKKCIYEELQIMEDNFETQIESVLANHSDKGNDINGDVPETKVLLREEEITEHDFRDNSTEITFFEKEDYLKPKTEVTAAGSSEQQSPKNIIDEFRTRSGRTVKPVRRLVDGCETSIGGENQYGLTDKQIDEDERANTMHDESENTTQGAEDSKETNNLQLDSKSDISPTGCEGDPKMGKNETNNIDKLSYISVNDQIDKTSDGTTEHLPMPTAKTDEMYSRKNPSTEEMRIKVSPLFAMNEDSIYQSEDIDTVQDGNGTYPKKETLEKNTPTLQPEHLAFVQSFEDSTFKDRKSIVKFVVAKLTGFDIEVKDKTHKLKLFDPSLSNDYPIVDSIFDKQLHCINSSDSSSLSSPPEIDVCDQIVDKDSQNRSKEEMNEHISMFDFIPAKREISREPDTFEECDRVKSNISEENVRHRTTLKRETAGSLNDSLCSLSTQQKSFNSLPFSTSRRSNRRLRRQGSRLSLKSLSNTQSTRSPYATPVENRSLVDGKQQIEASLVDHGGQMVRWDSDIEASFPGVPDTEEMTEAIERSELFHETLVAFSSLENLEFLSNFPHRKSTTVPKSTASLMWRQLVANWKHSELCKVMLTRPSSIPLSKLTRQTGVFNAEDDLSSMSTIHFRFDYGNVTFSNNLVSADAYLLLRCVNHDCYEATHDDFLVLTRFLCDFGPGLSSFDGGGNGSNVGSPLRHNLSVIPESEEHGGTPSITDIQREAKAQLKKFERLIDFIMKYSTQNDTSATDLEGNDITSSVGVKDYASIRNKATRKYDGDISQVKDVLRGEITFPDEGSLICGLYSLHSLAEYKGNDKQIGPADSIPSFQIVRLKNLFRTTSVGNEFYHALPTGYRHILINLKLECGIIAGKSFLMTIYRVYNIYVTHINFS